MAAIKGQQTALRVSTATASAKTITGITAASPPVVSSATHGFTAGQIIVLTGIVGMVELNDRAFVVANPLAGTFELKGVDATTYTAYASGGSATLQTMTEVGSITGIEGFDGEAGEEDATTLRSTAKEFLTGLQDFGNVTLNLNLVTDTGQARLRALKASASAAAFSITLSDGTVSAFRALPKSFTFSVGGPDSIVKGSVKLRVTGEPAWFS
jgi:hypothetical protein